MMKRAKKRKNAKKQTVALKDDDTIMWEVDRLGGQQWVRHSGTVELVLSTEVFFNGSLLPPEQLIGCPKLEPSGQKFECMPRLKYPDEEDKETKRQRKIRLKIEKDDDMKSQFCTRPLANRDSRIKHERLYCKAEGAPNHKCIDTCKRRCKGALPYNHPAEKQRGRKTNQERAENRRARAFLDSE